MRSNWLQVRVCGPLGALWLAGACTLPLQPGAEKCAPLADEWWVSETQPLDVVALELRNDAGNISKETLIVTPVYFHEQKDQPEDGYSAALVMADGTEAFSVGFEFRVPVYDDPFIDFVELEEITLFIPYTRCAESIEIYDPMGEQVLQVDLTFLWHLCGDGVCEADEVGKCLLDCH